MLATQGQNQTLSPQQVLTPLATHNAPAPQPPTVPSARKRLHYPEETKQNDILKNPSRGHSCYCDTHVQSQYFEHTSFRYHEMDTSYHNCRSMPNSLGSQEPNKYRIKKQFVHEHT